MNFRRAEFQEDLQFQVLRRLHEAPDLSQRTLAKELGISLGRLNFCFRALVEKGWIKVQNFSQSKNKFGYAYVLTPLGLVEKVKLTTRFLSRKMREYELLKVEIAELTQKQELEMVGDSSLSISINSEINLNNDRWIQARSATLIN